MPATGLRWVRRGGGRQEVKLAVWQVYGHFHPIFVITRPGPTLLIIFVPMRCGNEMGIKALDIKWEAVSRTGMDTPVTSGFRKLLSTLESPIPYYNLKPVLCPRVVGLKTRGLLEGPSF